jgi:hypothetical protein
MDSYASLLVLYWSGTCSGKANLASTSFMWMGRFVGRCILSLPFVVHVVVAGIDLSAIGAVPGEVSSSNKFGMGVYNDTSGSTRLNVQLTEVKSLIGDGGYVLLSIL